jgi:hypothetical protein
VTTPFVAALIAQRLGMRQFCGYDLSMVVDTGWRISIGQRAFRDFYMTVPPVFAFGAALAFRVFGTAWNSLVIFNTAVCLSFGVASVGLLWRGGYRSVTNLAPVSFACVIPVLVDGYWWHSSVTSVIAVFYLTSLMCWRRRLADTVLRVAVVSSTALLALSKPNVAIPMIGLTGASLILNAELRYAYLPLLAASAAAVLGLLYSSGTSVVGLVSSYAAVSGRAGLNLFAPPGAEPWSVYLSVGMIALLAAPSIFLLGRNRVSRTLPTIEVQLIIAALVSSYLGMRTNWDVKQNDFPLLIGGLSFVMPIVGTPDRFSLAAGRVFVSSCALTCGCLLSLGATRWRLDGCGYGAFYETQLDTTPFRDGFFSGLVSGARLHRVIDEVSAALTVGNRSKYSPKVFFGPRMEFCYAYFSLQSPTGLPVWWHPGSSFPEGDTDLIAGRFVNHRFDILIFLKSDFTRMPDSILRYLPSAYQRDDSNPELTVFRRRA